MAEVRRKELRRSYGFDEVAIVPGDVTLNPEQTNLDLTIGNHTLKIPFLASAMDAVVDVDFAVKLSQFGGLGILHLEGVQTRYENPEEVLSEIAGAPPEESTPLLQKIYSQPIKENLIGQRIQEIKKKGGTAAVAALPANAKQFAPVAVEAGVDLFSVMSTVTSARHRSKSVKGLKFEDLVKSVSVPVIVGNCVSYGACLELMRTGISAVLVGVGPGSACTTREVLGMGVPQITATIDCAAARNTYFKETGRYVPVITDGGLRKGGDICKAIVAGADGVMIGSVFAQAEDSPGKGCHWGMAASHAVLPRGTTIRVGTTGPLEQILFGPSSVTNGSHNLVGALRNAMGLCGAANIQEMQKAEMVIAPSITTEGKFWQLSGL